MQKRSSTLPPHPGKILRDTLLPQFGMTATEAAFAMHMQLELLFDILAERKPVSAEICLRIARLFGSSPEMWQRLQANYDMEVARQDNRIAQSLQKIVPADFFNQATA